MRRSLLSFFENLRLRIPYKKTKKARKPIRLEVEVLETRCTPTTGFVQTNLVSDQAGVAQFTDANLINPWGLAYSPTGPFWVADNNAGVSTNYTGQGQAQAPTVTVPLPPGATGTAAPDGLVFNGDSSAFIVSDHGASGSAQFLYATENGTIAGWSPNVDPNSAVLEVNNSATSVYKGLAIATDTSGQLLLYAANFEKGTIDVFNKTFQATTLTGHFQDPNLPAGFAPFGIQELNGELFVTYAKQDAAKANDVPQAGAGFVDVYTNDGAFVQRLASNGALNAPWGMAIAPTSFGSFAGDLLVGNFGDGRINIFNPTTGAALGQLSDGAGNPITIQGLWGLKVGNDAQAGSSQTLFFSAGPGGEAHGLFGTLQALPSTTPATGSGTVSGFAFLDANHNGIFDAGEAPLAGVTITLTGTPTFHTTPITPVTVTTDATGAFTFKNVFPGTYQVTAGAAEGLVDQASEGIFSVTTTPGVKVTSSSAVAGAQTVSQNAGFTGGAAPESININQFLTDSQATDFAIGTPGSGVALVNPKADNIVANALTPSNTSDSIDLAGAFADPYHTDTQVTFNITNGTTPEKLTVNLLDAKAPDSVANFLDYVLSGAYNNSVFHRLAAGFVLQGGGATVSSSGGSTTLTDITTLPDVPNEFSTSNTKGTLALAQSNSPDSGNSQFFFNLGNNTSLDSPNPQNNNTGPFTVFAQIADAASQTALTALGNDSVNDETTSSFAKPGLLANDFPLPGFTGSNNDPNLATDATINNLMVINSFTVAPNELLRYSLVSNSNPALVSTSFQGNLQDRLTLTKGTGTGSATIVVKATDSASGQSMTESFTVNVSSIATTTAVTSSTTTPVFGQAVTLTATVTPASGTLIPTGTVTFLDGTTTLGTGTVGSNKTATLALSSLALGSHTITASYAGDTNFLASSSPTSGTAVTVAKDGTTSIVTVPNTPPVFGQDVTLTATVSAASPGSGTPTGTVTFHDGTSSLGTGTLGANNTATLSLSSLAVGGHTITVSYAGDTDFTGSSGPSPGASLPVSAANTTTNVTVSQSPAPSGTTVTLTAVVAPVSPGSGVPTGTVTFLDGANTLGTATLDAPGTGTLAVSTLPQGDHTITASYATDGKFNSSTGPSPGADLTII